MLYKKGMTDLIVFIVIIFAIAVALPLIYYAFNLTGTALSSDFNKTNSNQSRDIIDNSVSIYPTLWDSAIILLFVAFWAITLITSFFLDSHPIFFVISLCIFLPALFAVIFIREFYINFAGLADLAFIELKFPMTYWLMSNIYVTSIIVGCSIFVALYAKTRYE